MKVLLFSTAAVIGLAFQAQAAIVTDQYQAFAPLGATSAPHATASSGAYEEGQTNSTGSRLSPFAGTTYDGRAYDAVEAGGTATFSASSFGGSNGAAGIFKFVYGSPDSYNTLTFSLGGQDFLTIQGSDIGGTPQSGYYLTQISNIGAYDAVTFGTGNTNAFEFAALSNVPLPASAPLFGGALLALGAVGYAFKNKKVASAA